MSVYCYYKAATRSLGPTRGDAWVPWCPHMSMSVLMRMCVVANRS